MKGKSTTDAIFAPRQLQERYIEGQQDLQSVFIDLEKHTTEFIYIPICKGQRSEPLISPYRLFALSFYAQS